MTEKLKGLLPKDMLKLLVPSGLNQLTSQKPSYPYREA